MKAANTLKATLLILAILALPSEVKATSNRAASTLPTDVAQLVQTCAPDVHPDTMARVLGHESGFHPYIIGVNERDKPRQVFRLKDAKEAAQKADQLIAQGKSIDMGLGQIWSGNLSGLNMTTAQVFDPCTNVATAARILTEAYERATAQGFEGTHAMDQALSIYNTGKLHNGIRNGYVAQVRAKRYRVPSLDGTGMEQTQPAVQLRAEPQQPPPPWDVFANASYRGPRQAEQSEQPPQEARPEQEPPKSPVMLFGNPA